MSEPLPNEVFFFLFGIEAVILAVFAYHAFSVARETEPGVEREVSVSLAWMLILTVIVDKLFFAFAFYIGAAVLSPIGLVIFVPGLFACGWALISWVKARGTS